MHWGLQPRLATIVSQEETAAYCGKFYAQSVLKQKRHNRSSVYYVSSLTLRHSCVLIKLHVHSFLCHVLSGYGQVSSHKLLSWATQFLPPTTHLVLVLLSIRTNFSGSFAVFPALLSSVCPLSVIAFKPFLLLLFVPQISVNPFYLLAAVFFKFLFNLKLPYYSHTIFMLFFLFTDRITYLSLQLSSERKNSIYIYMRYKRLYITQQFFVSKLRIVSEKQYSLFLFGHILICYYTTQIFEFLQLLYVDVPNAEFTTCSVILPENHVFCLVEITSEK